TVRGEHEQVIPKSFAGRSEWTAMDEHHRRQGSRAARQRHEPHIDRESTFAGKAEALDLHSRPSGQRFIIESGQPALALAVYRCRTELRRRVKTHHGVKQSLGLQMNVQRGT